MRIARVNVYLPDELAERARAAGLNISGVAQDALRGALMRAETDSWLDRLDARPRAEIAPGRVIDAVDAAREELGAGASD
jgi:post-segregation antitoxin (ccd killing protein)